jgi:hypothetical protein
MTGLGKYSLQGTPLKLGLGGLSGLGLLVERAVRGRITTLQVRHSETLLSPANGENRFTPLRGHLLITYISTRLFFARPAASKLEARGLDFPIPCFLIIESER